MARSTEYIQNQIKFYEEKLESKVGWLERQISRLRWDMENSKEDSKKYGSYFDADHLGSMGEEIGTIATKIRTLKDVLVFVEAEVEVQEPPAPVVYKIVKDDNDWDYSTHREDVERWREKILKEEPDSDVEIAITSMKEWEAWRGF